METVDQTDLFEAERPRLVGIASRVLGDHAEAQDVVQQAWLRLNGAEAEIESLPAWLTTVTTRLCLDRLRSRGLGHKRSLALREYALGLEALDRLAAGEPLWRIHEAVFAVLALESEPVDPRL